jgi:hypothetical protein
MGIVLGIIGIIIAIVALVKSKKYWTQLYTL